MAFEASGFARFIEKLPFWQTLLKTNLKIWLNNVNLLVLSTYLRKQKMRCIVKANFWF